MFQVFDLIAHIRIIMVSVQSGKRCVISFGIQIILLNLLVIVKLTVEHLSSNAMLIVIIPIIAISVTSLIVLNIAIVCFIPDRGYVTMLWLWLEIYIDVIMVGWNYNLWRIAHFLLVEHLLIILDNFIDFLVYRELDLNILLPDWVLYAMNALD